jgi:hypothetical protein
MMQRADEQKTDNQGNQTISEARKFVATGFATGCQRFVCHFTESCFHIIRM